MKRERKEEREKNVAKFLRKVLLLGSTGV
jgi:hypothetical protein